MGRAVGEGLRAYYQAKIEELEIQARDKQHNLRRLEAQRNDLNTKGTLLQLQPALRWSVAGLFADQLLCAVCSEAAT